MPAAEATAPTTQPSRSGRLLALVRKLIDYARELAARFIPPSSDPMWSQAAQEIFVACIVHLTSSTGIVVPVDEGRHL